MCSLIKQYNSNSLIDNTNMYYILLIKIIINNLNYIPSLFHAKSITSSKVSDFDPGVIGVLILCKSQMNISDSDAPDANKLV